MSNTSSRILRALRDLAIAMINATLILVLLCLILGLRLTSRVDDVTTHFAESLVSVEPLREDVRSMTGEIAGLRSDLGAIRENSGELTSETARALTARLDQFESRLDGVRDRLQSVEFDPQVMVDHAIETAANETAAAFGSLVGCELPAADALDQRVPPAGDTTATQ